MSLIFYPQLDDANRGGLEDRIEILMEGAERYKAVILDVSNKSVENNKRMVPKDQTAAYNWEEIASVLYQIRSLPESNKIEKLKKSELLAKLAEVYEVLRAAKMSKLEAVRLALISEANQLSGGKARGA